jgi:hypothetical protein
MPEGVQTWGIRLKTSTGTFTLPASRSNWWVESRDLAGGLGAGTPDVQHNEPVDDTPYNTIDDNVSITLLALPIDVPVNQAVDHDPVVVTDAVDITFGFAAGAGVPQDDGWCSGFPNIVTTGTQVEMGNSAGEMRQGWFRFAVPSALQGVSVLSARLRLWADAQTIAGKNIRLKIAIDNQLSPPNPTSYTDYAARTQTVLKYDWDLLNVADGQALETPDFGPALQEAIDTNGDVTHFLVLIYNDASDTDGRVIVRSSEHATAATRPQLLVQYV